MQLKNPSSTSIPSRKRRFPCRWTTRARSPRPIRRMRNGWRVTAEPDGTLYDEAGNEYSYLFWEGEDKTDYDFSKGFCVAGADTADFSPRKTGRDRSDTARVQRIYRVLAAEKCRINPYNLISFQSEAYTDAAKLDIDPNRTAFSAYSWRGSHWADRRPSSRRHSRRLRETASLSLNGAAAR